MPVCVERRARCALGLVLCAAIWTPATAVRPAAALATAPLSWSAPASIDPGAALSAIDCPSRTLCVAVDRSGRVLASAAPAAGRSSWKFVASDSGHALSAVSCASSRLCAAVDEAGRVLVSATPASAGGWSVPWSIDGTTALSAVSCPTTTLCVALDRTGQALVSGDPGAGGQPWKAATIDSGHVLRSLSCSSAQLCVAVDDAGSALVSSEPGEGAAKSWRKHEVDRAVAIDGVSCAQPSTCVAVDGLGEALASADPAASTPTWSATGIDSRSLAGVSCASSGLCVAVDGGGEALASDSPTASAPSWSSSRVDPGVALGAVSCDGEGLCAAVAEGGSVLTASVPAPVSVTGAAAEVGQTTAALTGTADSNDALASECRFEYGTTLAYGGSAPCSALPSSNGGPQPIGASIGGLAPGTVYHYRLVLVSGAGEGAGSDQTFTTVRASLVRPRPSISGVPAVGSRLLCNAGVPLGESVTLAYAWWRDGAPIAGATASHYRVSKADATHHLQCRVTATDVAGSATGSSAYVTIPAQGIVAAVDETVVGRARFADGRVSVPIRCSPRSAGACALTLRLMTVRTARHRRIAVTIGSLRARLRPGERRTLVISLDALGRRLLAHSKRLTAHLSVAGTVIGVLKAQLSNQRLTLQRRSR